MIFLLVVIAAICAIVKKLQCRLMKKQGVSDKRDTILIVTQGAEVKNFHNCMREIQSKTSNLMRVSVRVSAHDIRQVPVTMRRKLVLDTDTVGMSFDFILRIKNCVGLSYGWDDKCVEQMKKAPCNVVLSTLPRKSMACTYTCMNRRKKIASLYTQGDDQPGVVNMFASNSFMFSSFYNMRTVFDYPCENTDLLLNAVLFHHGCVAHIPVCRADRYPDVLDRDDALTNCPPNLLDLLRAYLKQLKSESSAATECLLGIRDSANVEEILCKFGTADNYAERSSSIPSNS